MSTSKSSVDKYQLKYQPPVEAIRWTGENFELIKAWRNQLNGVEIVSGTGELRVRPKIGTNLYARRGDWVVCRNSEYYVFTDMEFKRLYEPAEES